AVASRHRDPAGPRGRGLGQHLLVLRRRRLGRHVARADPRARRGARPDRREERPRGARRLRRVRRGAAPHDVHGL
ncbi:MAG: hypothetical protein AVDCRST_MAG13-1292, partial [uncultured Solirubrobacteraceae bacterium]